MVLNEAFVRHDDGKHYFWADDLNIVRDEHAHVISATLKADGKPVHYEGWTTMSKSKNNGVDPQELIAKYGADTARLFVMFASPPEQTLEWSDEGVQGQFRFLRRLWKAVYDHANAGPMPPPGAPAASAGLDAAGAEPRRHAHQTVVRVTDDIARRRVFNTAIAAGMELLNAVARYDQPGAQARAVRHEVLELAVLCLSPMVPHICHELWFALGHERALIDEPWPTPD